MTVLNLPFSAYECNATFLLKFRVIIESLTKEEVILSDSVECSEDKKHKTLLVALGK
jgi:hypothetical protein